MREAVGLKLFSQFSLYSLNDLMCSIAILLFISGVTASAKAHDISLLSWISPNLIGRREKRFLESYRYLG